MYFAFTAGEPPSPITDLPSLPRFGTVTSAAMMVGQSTHLRRLPRLSTLPLPVGKTRSCRFASRHSVRVLPQMHLGFGEVHVDPA